MCSTICCRDFESAEDTSLLRVRRVFEVAPLLVVPGLIRGYQPIAYRDNVDGPVAHWKPLFLRIGERHSTRSIRAMHRCGARSQGPTAVSRQMILLVMTRDVSRSSTEFRQLDLLGLEAWLLLHDLNWSTFQFLNSSSNNFELQFRDTASGRFDHETSGKDFFHERWQFHGRPTSDRSRLRDGLNLCHATRLPVLSGVEPFLLLSFLLTRLGPHKFWLKLAKWVSKNEAKALFRFRVSKKSWPGEAC